MTPTRATAYVGLASVLVAWLAGAAGVSVPSGSLPRHPPPSDAATAQAIADDVQSQVSRLRGRLAHAPVPRAPVRNPFGFAPRAVRSAVVAARAPEPVAAPAGEPPLQLVGVAARETASGLVRTAMITADSDELFMLLEGETLGGRYRVASVGAEVVELTDLMTSATRRLTLR